MEDKNCVSYKNNIYEYILPSHIIGKKLCLSYDKTELFIVSLIRLIIYIILLKLFDRYNYIRYIFYVLMIINLIYMVVIIYKTPVIRVNTDKSVMNTIQL